MQNEQRVTRMRKLLAEAANCTQEPRRPYVIRHAGESFPLDALSKRAMVKQVNLAASRYGLQGDVDVYVALAGCASVGGLTSEQLQGLARWCSDSMDRMATGSHSPDAPPAF